MIIHARTMALAVFSHGHTRFMGNGRKVRVTALTTVPEVKLNLQDVFEKVLDVIRAETRYLAGIVAH